MAGCVAVGALGAIFGFATESKGNVLKVCPWCDDEEHTLYLFERKSGLGGAMRGGFGAVAIFLFVGATVARA